MIHTLHSYTGRLMIWIAILFLGLLFFLWLLLGTPTQRDDTRQSSLAHQIQTISKLSTLELIRIPEAERIQVEIQVSC